MSPALRFCFGVLAVLIGCHPGVAAAQPSERAKVEGFAVVRVIYNGVTVYDDIVIERVDGNRRDVSLSGPVPTGIANPVTYAGWLDPGTYRFLRFLTTSEGAYIIGRYGRFDVEALDLPTFTVAAGELVDLGTWLYQPFGERAALTLLNDHPQAFGQGRKNRDLEEAAPAFAGLPTRWDGAERWRPGVAVDELLASSKQATGVMKPPRFDAEGNAYFASTLGQILRRTPRGEWRNLDTGTLDTLSSLWVEGSNIYASTEQRRLLQSSDGGASWAAAVVPGVATVTAIARLPTGDFVAAAEATEERGTQLFRGADFLALPETPWTTLETGRAPKFEPRAAAIGGPIADRLVVWTQPRSLHIYDIANDRWSSSKAKRPLADLYVNESAGLIYAAGPIHEGPLTTASGWKLLDGLISADAGTTWQSVNLRGHNGLGFRDRLNGIAMIPDAVFAATTIVATTSDGGTTWNKVEAPTPGFCVAAQYLPPTDEFVCMTWNADILTTRTGREWVTERRGVR